MDDMMVANGYMPNIIATQKKIIQSKWVITI